MANVKGSGAVRKSTKVGPDYDESRYARPWGADMDSEHGNKTDKTLHSPNATTVSPGEMPVHETGYNKLWEGE